MNLKRADGGHFAPKTCHIALVLAGVYRADCRSCSHSTDIGTERNRVIEAHLRHFAEMHEQTPACEPKASTVTRQRSVCGADAANERRPGTIS